MHRNSVFKSIFLNPLVWIGCVLTAFSLHYEGEIKAFELFYKPETYRNLLIGAAIYVMIFTRHYKHGRSKLDIKATLLEIITTAYKILFIWLITLALIANFRIGGQNYSAALTKKYRENGIGKYGTSEYQNQIPKNAIIIPQQDGSYKIEFKN